MLILIAVVMFYLLTPIPGSCVTVISFHAFNKQPGLCPMILLAYLMGKCKYFLIVIDKVFLMKDTGQKCRQLKALLLLKPKNLNVDRFFSKC